MNFGMLATMILANLIRGPGNGKKSIFGLYICDIASWLVFTALVSAATIMTALASRLANWEYDEKRKIGYTFTKGDQKLTLRNSARLCFVAFSDSFFAAVSGIGPGIIFNSVLIQYDMHPAVASATGMYLTLYTTLSSTLNLLIN